VSNDGAAPPAADCQGGTAGVCSFWLTATFTSFGLFAPRNAIVLATFFVCALSVAGAIFLILELDGPFDGLIRISPEPVRYALARIGR